MERNRGIVRAVEYPLLAQIRDIGSEDDTDIGDGDGDGDDLTSGLDMMERPDTRVSKEEEADMHDLLGKMLRYHSSDRISIDEVLRHRWVSQHILNL